MSTRRSIGGSIFITSNLRQAFQAAWVQIELPDGWLNVHPVEPCETAGSFPVDGLLHIVTAWNPFSVPLSATANGRRHAALLARLDTKICTWFDAVGRSPDSMWSELGVAIVGMERAEVVALANHFGQLAIFEWADEPDGFRIIECATGLVTTSGWQTSPIA